MRVDYPGRFRLTVWRGKLSLPARTRRTWWGGLVWTSAGNQWIVGSWHGWMFSAWWY